MLFNGLTKSRAIQPLKRNSPSNHSNVVVPFGSPHSSLLGESPSTISSAPTPMALSLPTPTSQSLPMSTDDIPLDNAPSSSQLSHFSTTITATPAAAAAGGGGLSPSSLNKSFATLFFNAQQSRHHTTSDSSSHPPTPTSVTPTATRSYDDGGTGDSNLETIQLAPSSPASTTGSIFVSSKLPISSSSSSSFAGSNTPTPPTRLSLGKLMDFPTNLLHIPTKMQDVSASMWARHKRYSSGGREISVSYVIMCLKIKYLCVLCILYRANTVRPH
jgi:hypothetical protein